jgi:hypothetical protein
MGALLAVVPGADEELGHAPTCEATIEYVLAAQPFPMGPEVPQPAAKMIKTAMLANHAVDFVIMGRPPASIIICKKESAARRYARTICHIPPNPVIPSPFVLPDPLISNVRVEHTSFSAEVDC